MKNIWDETLMEDGTMPSIAGSRKQQVYVVVEDDVKLLFVCRAIFSHTIYYLQVMANFYFYFWWLLFLCWTHVLWCGLFCAIALMNYKQEVKQGRRIRGILWDGVERASTKWKCVEKINGCLFWFLGMSLKDWLSCWILCCWRWWNIHCTMCLCKHESSSRVWFKGWWLGHDEILKGFWELVNWHFKLCMCCFTMFVCALCKSTLMKGSSKIFRCLLDHYNCSCRFVKML